MDATEAETYLDESEEPLFADDLDDDDDIPAPPSPVNQDEIRRRVRLQVANSSSRAGENSLTFASTSPSWPDGQGGDSSAAVVDPSSTEQPVPIKKRKPILTLGPDRLTGERGFKVLKDEFPLIKFQGRGHEASDLKLLLSRYEHWAHRLFPKLTFQDVLQRIEKLAGGKEVKHCLNQMRVGREFQTTIDSSEGEEDDGGGGRESLHDGEMQQASSTAMDDANEVCAPLNGGTEARPGSAPATHRQSGEDHNTVAQLPVNRVSPVPDADSDSDDEWNMLGRRVTSKDQHSPHKDEPAKITVNSASPDADSDSDDEWNMLGRRVVSSKDHHSPHKEGLAKAAGAEALGGAAGYVKGTVHSGREGNCGVLESTRGGNTLKEGERVGCGTEGGGTALASQNGKQERHDELHVNDDQSSDSVTQLADTNADSCVQTTSHGHLVAERDTSNSTGNEVQDTGEQEAMDIDAPQLLIATEDSSGVTATELNSAPDTELLISQNELDEFFAE